MVPFNYFVTNLNDSGPGSLRQAVLDANSVAGTDAVIFDVPAGGTITLNSEIAISGYIGIYGPATRNITISGGGAARLFNTTGTNGTAPGTQVYLENLTLTSGLSGLSYGGAILADDESIELYRCRLIGNTALAGGAIYFSGQAGGSLTVEECTLSGNVANGFSGSVLNGGGAIRMEYGGSLWILNSTLSGNSALASTAEGGAIYFYGSAAGTGVKVENSTIVGNSSGGSGGAIGLVGGTGGGTCVITNCTVVGNSAGTGGGLFRSNTAIPVTISNTVVSGNTAGSGPDVSNASGSTTANNCAFSSTLGFTPSGIGNIVNPLASLLLGPLADNGGLTLTMLPSLGSPLINAGSATTAFTFDQRGRQRKNGAAVDIGATEWTPLVVNTNDSGVGSLRQAIVDTNALPGADTIVFDIPAGGTIILQSELSITGSVAVQGPSAKNISISGGGTVRLFNSDLAASSDSISLSNLSLINGKVTGAGAAIFVGNESWALSGCTITGNSASTVGGAIRVGGYGSLSLSNCTLSGNTAGTEGGAVRFYGAGGVTLNVTSSTFSGNRAANGGAVFLSGNIPTANLTGITVTNNVASASGGGVRVNSVTGTLNISSTTISGNTATSNDGGGINASNSTLSINQSTIAGNSAGGNGGGLNQVAGSVSVTNSTVSGNRGNQGGGVRCDTVATTMLIQNSTVANNTAADGGAFRLSNCNGQLLLRNSTVVGNSASVNGGGINRFSGTGTIALESTILSGNLDADNSAPDVENNGTTFSRKNSAVGSSAGLTADSDLLGNLPFQAHANLKLGPLANNGGPTQTMLPAIDSPLLDQGVNPASLTLDQRGTGFPRVIGLIDIGAVELPVFVVRNASDAGTGSLRQAIADSNASSGQNSVTFDPAVFASPTTITLTTGQISVTKSMTITGPAAQRVTIDGNKAGRILDITATNVAVSIQNLTLTNGSVSGDGGAINSGIGVTVTLDGCWLANNTATSNGGAVNIFGGQVTILNSTLSSNSANQGGGLRIANGGTNLLVRNSTIANNLASDGGAIRLFLTNNPLTIQNSTIFGNTASGNGSGINRFSGSGTISLESVVLSGNVDTSGGTSPDVENNG
ncbi:MAG: hypothetical protein K1X57_21350, partial [Gemmataceae bacterium]|nr:hypothetical protein [Gemmataceae bacterium]